VIVTVTLTFCTVIERVYREKYICKFYLPQLASEFSVKAWFTVVLGMNTYVTK